MSVSNSLIDSAKAIDSLVDAGGNTDSMRMKGMAAVAGALKTRSLAKEATSAAKGLVGGVNVDSLKGLGNTRIQATIGSQKSQSNSSSYTEINQGSNITTNNLALIATGAGTNSNINVNGSNLNVTNNALFQADNDFNVSGVAQNSNTRSTNKSSSTAIGGFADTRGSAGITASASKGKGYANSDSVTYANSQLNIGGTTTFDIGNDVNIKGGVINTNKAQGQILGDVNIESLQDTSTYESDQKNIGFSADIDIAGGGAGSSLSVNGGKTDINADYKAVGQQSGIFTGDGGFNLTVDGKTDLIGGAITTTDAAVAAGLNNYVSKGGITTRDIENTSNYEGDAIQVGISLGMTDNKPQGNTNGLGYGTDSDSDSSTTRAGITGIAGNSGITTDNREEYAGALENGFDETRVNEELGAQTQITQAFDQERRKIKTEINAKEKALRDEAEAASDSGDYQTAQEKFAAADKLVNQGLLFDAVAGAIYGPNSNGTIGYVAKAVSPAVSFKIGQYYKDLEANQDDKLTGGQEAGHILAHALLGAAVSYATGNDALTGGVSAGTAEAAAPLLSQLLYEKDTNELTAEQKDTVSSIVSALGAGIGATTGNSSEAANSAEISKVAAENNDGGPQTYGQSKAELMKETWEMNNGPIGKFLNKNQKYILIGTDFLPVIGDIKGVKEAEDTGDYVFAAIGLFPLYGDALQKAHKAEKAYQQAKVAEDVEGMKKASQEAVNVLKSQGKASEATGSQIIKKVESGQNVKPAKVKQSDTGVVTQPTNKASFNDISKDIDKWSLTPISDRQKGMIYDKLSTVKQRSKEQTEQMRKNGFSKAKQRELISQWENETGSVWPAGATPHHAIPLKNGGSNEWWNLVPVKHPHTGTIHGTGSALRENLPYSIKPGIITEIK